MRHSVHILSDLKSVNYFLVCCCFVNDWKKRSMRRKPWDILNQQTCRAGVIQGLKRGITMWGILTNIQQNLLLHSHGYRRKRESNQVFTPKLAVNKLRRSAFNEPAQTDLATSRPLPTLSITFLAYTFRSRTWDSRTSALP